MKIEDWIGKIIDVILLYGPKLLLALIIWILGSWLIKKLIRLTGNIALKIRFRSGFIEHSPCY